MYDVAIIGGGVTGLSAAYNLSKAGKKVVVLEKDEYLGGLVSSWDIGGYKIEKFYHHLSKNDAYFFNFLKELKIDKSLKWKLGSVGYYYDNKVYKLDTPIDILKFKGLNLIDTLRIGFIVLWIKLTRDYSDLDDIQAKEWLIKMGGRRVYDNFFKPLLKSKFGKNMDEVSAAWLFGRLKWRSRRSLSGEKLGYMEHGFHEFIDKLCKEIKKNDGKIFTGTEVKSIKINDGAVSGVTTSTQNIAIENVISTIPPKELIKLCEFPEDFRKKLENIKYQRTICALFGLNEKLLDKVYWLNIKSKTLPFGALIEHTNFHNIPEYKEDHIVYAVAYVQSGEDELWRMTDEELISTFIEGLKAMFPHFSRNSVNWWRLAKGVYSSPIYKRGYLKDIGKINSPINGLHITGMFMMYPERSMEGSVKFGREIAMEVINKEK